MIATTNDATPAKVDRSKAIAKRDAWNEAHGVGTYVRVWQSLPDGQWLVTWTTGQAFIHGHGVAVCVAFSVAPIYLSNLEPISAEALALLTHDGSLDRVNRELAIETEPTTNHPRRQAPRRDSQLPVGDR